MSLITQCPACSTMFKVVPDQLRISDGWVRCGQCDEVFDANANLHSAPVSVSLEPEPTRDPVATTSPDPDWAASLRFASDDIPLESARVLTEVSPSVDQSPDPVSNDYGGDEDSSADSQERDPSEPRLDDFLSQSPKVLAQAPGVDYETPLLETSAPPALETLSGPALRCTQAHGQGTENAGLKQPSFMRQNREGSVWQKTGMRVLLSLSGVVLLGILAIQVGLHERDRWAVIEPSMRPVLEALCGLAKCNLRPLRNIEAVVIDSSSFTKVRTDVYRLNVTLKNNGPVPVAPPALELTLTDMQDQSLIRRVLKPQDIGFKSITLEPGVEFSAAIPIAVKAGSSSARVSGYRLLAFYP